MSLTHNKYSGFFPFYTIPYSTLPPGWGYEMPLASLVQCYWLAKSATLTVNINYNATRYGYINVSPPTQPDSIITYDGSITGTGTISDFTSGSLIMALPPAQRAAYNTIPNSLVSFGSSNFEGSSVPMPTYLVDNGIYTSVVAGHPSENQGPYPYTSPAQGFYMSWFTGGGWLASQGGVAYDPTASPEPKWYTDLQCSLVGFDYQINSMGTNDYYSPSSTQATILLQANGVTLAEIPFYSFLPSNPDPTTYPPTDACTIDGLITLDFDTFWTP